MTTTTVGLMNGPMHGIFKSIDGICPSHLRFPVQRELDIGEFPQPAMLPVSSDPAIAVYRRGEMEKAPPPMRGMIGVYWFQSYEEVPSEPDC